MLKVDSERWCEYEIVFAGERGSPCGDVATSLCEECGASLCNSHEIVCHSCFTVTCQNCEHACAVHPTQPTAAAA